MQRIFAFLALILTFAPAVKAQDLTIATVSRPPFSMLENGQETGFGLDLWAALAADLGKTYQLRRVNEFQEMLRLVENGAVDAAVANISITASREEAFDFSQPIFESGLQILIPADQNSSLSILSILLSRDLIIAIVLAFALLFGGGLLMWRFERDSQPYFDRTAKEAMFPAFWWALNLVVNGGFEERMPRTVFGRIFGVFLVVSSLFIVSIFVAKITAVLTIDAIQSSVVSINDLHRQHVGTIEGSTASMFLDNRDLKFTGFDDFAGMMETFEKGGLDAIVFDAPILAFYAKQSAGKAQLVGPIFMRENYGIALPSGSALAEPLNRSLLRLREDGTYTTIYRKWFGNRSGT